MEIRRNSYNGNILFKDEKERWYKLCRTKTGSLEEYSFEKISPPASTVLSGQATEEEDLLIHYFLKEKGKIGYIGINDEKGCSGNRCRLQKVEDWLIKEQGYTHNGYAINYESRDGKSTATLKKVHGKVTFILGTQSKIEDTCVPAKPEIRMTKYLNKLIKYELKKDKSVVLVQVVFI